MNLMKLMETATIRIVTVDTACCRSADYGGARTVAAIGSRLAKEREGGKHWSRAIAVDPDGIGVDLETGEVVQLVDASAEMDDHNKAIVRAFLSKAGKKKKGKRTGFDYAAFSRKGVEARAAKKAAAAKAAGKKYDL